MINGFKSDRLFAATFITLLCACAPGCKRTEPAPSAGIDFAGMDASVAPGDDFNAYTNGGWAKVTPIPADKASFGTDAILADQTRKEVLGLLEEAGKPGSSSTGDARKAADFYASYMNEAGIESKGVAPLKTE